MATRGGARKRNQAPQRFTLRVDSNALLLYDRHTHEYTRRNTAEAFLMVASLEAPMPVARKLLARKVGQEQADVAYRSLREQGVLDRGDRFHGRVVELAPLHQAFGAPLVAHLGVTLACNFSCAHCYSSSGKRAPGELTLNEIKELIGQLDAMGCMKLVLGGGEPFLRRELPDITAHAHQCGVDTYIHTNASLLKPSVLKALAAHPPAGLSVSLDGPDDATNDVVRGPGTFERALVGLQALRQHYPPGFNISVTITPRNASHAAEMVALAHREKAGVLLLRPAYPAGEALLSPDLVCDRDTFAQAIDLARARARDLGVVVDAPHPYEQGVPSFEGFGCVAGKVVLGISPTGDVTPCLNLPDAHLSGNLREQPLLDLWRHGHAFDSLRREPGNEQCQSCLHQDTCRGGCRVRSLWAGNGISGPDSWCHYEPRPGVHPVRFAPKGGSQRLRVVS